MPVQTSLTGTWPQAVALEDALCRGAPEPGEAQLAHLPRELAATPAAILPRQTQYEQFRLWIGPGSPWSALGLEGPVVTHDLPVPADESGRLDDHGAVQQLCVLHSDTREQQTQLLGSAEPRALPHLTLQDEHLLAQGENLPVAIVAEQAGEQ